MNSETSPLFDRWSWNETTKNVVWSGVHTTLIHETAAFEVFSPSRARQEAEIVGSFLTGAARAKCHTCCRAEFRELSSALASHQSANGLRGLSPVSFETARVGLDVALDRSGCVLDSP